MRFALVNSERIEASPKLKGLCPGCGQDVIPKCGTKRIKHWAHRSEMACDRWWETETEWHRLWKDNFPLEWQEYRQQDLSSDEWHIADVRTDHGLVIEFQHSSIDPLEVTKREVFYKNMIWVVDAEHRKNDYKRFLKGAQQFRQISQGGLYLVARPEQCFPISWTQSTKPVFFDFRGAIPTDPPDMVREFLWCLLPGRVEGNAVVIKISRMDVISEAVQNSDLVKVLLDTRDKIEKSLRQPQQRITPQSLTTAGRQQYYQRRRRRF